MNRCKRCGDAYDIKETKGSCNLYCSARCAELMINGEGSRKHAEEHKISIEDHCAGLHKQKMLLAFQAGWFAGRAGANLHLTTGEAFDIYYESITK